MTIHALLFEAKSIQDYLFQSGRLRDVIGASELVDSLTGVLLDDALSALGLKRGRHLDIPRSAGGAYYAFSENGEALDRLLALWTLLVQQYAPGMAYDLGRGAGDTALAAFDDARQAMRADTSRHRSALPVAAPITQRSRRTGLAAVYLDAKDGPLDSATRRKRALAIPKRLGVLQRFSPPESDLEPDDWPRNLEADEENAFPFEGDDRTLALIHADGNGLGQILRNVRDAVGAAPATFIPVFEALSASIAKCAEAAAQEATRKVLLPAKEGHGRMPARPVLLGGDDLTILVRADLALEFVRVFTGTFESRSPEYLQGLRDLGVANLPGRLTLGAGIVYLGAGQPFHLAIKLAEELTVKAKEATNRTGSACAFHRVTGSLVDDYETILVQERTNSTREGSYVDTLGGYRLGQASEGPRLDDLLHLQGILQHRDMARGPTRQLLTLIGLSPAQAKNRYRRWKQLMLDHRKGQLDTFHQVMGALTPGYDKDGDLPFTAEADSERRLSPLGDALALMAVGNALPAIRAEGEPKEDA